MNMGSICGLVAALLISFLPTTRLLYSLAQDGLLSLGSHASSTLNHLYGTGGSPRVAVLVVVFVVCLLVVLVPKTWLVRLVPLKLCLRLLSQAVLLFNSNFASEKSSQLVGQLPCHATICISTANAEKAVAILTAIFGKLRTMR
jgi:amino acid transporter